MASNATSVLCDACARLGTGSPGAEPHSALFDRGSRQLSSGKNVDHVFRCADCNTIWTRRIDKWGIEGSFRLVSDTRVAE